MATLSFDIWPGDQSWQHPMSSMDIPGCDGRPPKALILDADPALCRQVGLALKSLGIETDTFCEASEAMNAARSTRYAVAVIDVGLVQGFDVCHRLSRGDAGRRIPVLAFASGGSFLERLKARRHGAQSFVSKPAPLDRFLRAVWQTACSGRANADVDAPVPSSA